MQVFETYKYPILGGILGLMLALLFITFGIFKTLILLIFAILGMVVGLYFQKTGLLEDFLKQRKNNK